MDNNREIRMINLKLGCSVFLSLYAKFYRKFNLFYTFEFFLLCLLYAFVMDPFLTNKLQIRKLANYHDGRERAFSAIITLPIFALIIYSVE